MLLLYTYTHAHNGFFIRAMLILRYRDYKLRIYKYCTLTIPQTIEYEYGLAYCCRQCKALFYWKVVPFFFILCIFYIVITTSDIFKVENFQTMHSLWSCTAQNTRERKPDKSWVEGVNGLCLRRQIAKPYTEMQY